MITENIDSLRQKSSPFVGTEKELQSIFDCLEYELFNNKTLGIGLSGIQINIPYKVAIIRIKKEIKHLGLKREIKIFHNLYNAEIIDKQQKYIFKGEGCLSFPGKFLDTVRYNLIKLKNGDGKILQFSGFEAVTILHEIDHWNGILFIDRILAKENQNEKDT